MGIRYDRDSRKATNGPIVFFSILKDEAFDEEITSAFYQGLSFYAYRFPHASMMSYGSSEGYIEGIGVPGFIIGMFSPEKPIITIPYSGTKRGENSTSYYQMPDVSTTYEEYSHEVDSIIKWLEGKPLDKVVAARVILREGRINLADQFFNLCQRFPDAFVFCFSTPATGCWIGASPELLLKGENGRLDSMALAGTRPAGTPGVWDEKNKDEQKIVTDYIKETFIKNGLTPKIGETYTKETGAIEHICTPIWSESILSDQKFSFLIKDLSPTPALCGYPKENALKEIGRLEHFDRGCYGGFCGPFHSFGDFHFNVVVRCGSVNEKSLCIYTGGGITYRSSIKEEWEETALKAENTFGK